MINQTSTLFTQKYLFEDTSFKLLMQKRIQEVLIICSSYDSFILEEDGRVDEQIFNEYVSLNLRYPPHFRQVSTAEAAFRVLGNEHIDLIINMLSIGDMDPFELGKALKKKYPDIPIVVLTPFSREVNLKLKKNNLEVIDYVFSWLGNADILLAIIKLLEDKLNAEYDVEEVGVQAILLVEDSVRFISSYLPNMYKIIFKQSKDYTTEGLNEHLKMLRMRGRPKILLAGNYEEAVQIFHKYKHNLLGVISDMEFPRLGELDKNAGIKLFEMVKNEDPFMPFLLQSSDDESGNIAKNLNISHLNKNSKTLSLELREYLIDFLSFGDFIFIDPDDNHEICRAQDLQTFQQRLVEIPDKTLKYHIERNHFSKWLNARALFPLAQFFKQLTTDDFRDLDEIRRFIFDTIASYRLSKGRGVIAEFERDRFDEYFSFARIGKGSIGGKARGLAFINTLIKNNRLWDKFPDVHITIPRTVVLATDIFDEFMEVNDLYKIGLSDLPDEIILENFVNAHLPVSIHEDIVAFINVVKRPIAVRSSSLLEDSHYQPFAGVYSTYMIPKVPDDEMLMIELLGNAIKSVYASVFYKGSKAYMQATSNVIDEEKMAVVLQEVCGKAHGNLFYPTISGVARSINFYPIEPEKSEDGIATIAYGLGKYIVEGSMALRFSPKYPTKIIQLSSVETALKDTQKYFFALDLNQESFYTSTDDGVNILKVPLKEAENDPAFKYTVSTFDFQNNILRPGMNIPGKRIVTFANILQHNVIPLPEILSELLHICQREMNNPVEIEFAMSLNTAKTQPKVFNFLQIRPIVETAENLDIDLHNVKQEETIICSKSALGNGIIKDVYDFVYIIPEAFASSDTNQIAIEIEKINEKFVFEKRNYVLVGPGRWGSSDPWLGIPVVWSQISQARLIVESGLENFRIDPSQGTHFFQNLTSFRVGYFTINPYIKDGFYDLDYLKAQTAVYESKYIRHVRFNTPIIIQIDGKKNLGVVLKAE